MNRIMGIQYYILDLVYVTFVMNKIHVKFGQFRNIRFKRTKV